MHIDRQINIYMKRETEQIIFFDILKSRFWHKAIPGAHKLQVRILNYKFSDVLLTFFFYYYLFQFEFD